MNRTAEIRYKEYWGIRVVKDSITKKTVVKEISLDTPPNEQDLVKVLLECNDNEFVTVGHNFRMDK